MEANLEDGRGKSPGSKRTQFQPGHRRLGGRRRKPRPAEPEETVKIWCARCSRYETIPLSVSERFLGLRHQCGTWLGLENRLRAEEPKPDEGQPAPTGGNSEPVASPPPSRNSSRSPRRWQTPLTKTPLSPAERAAIEARIRDAYDYSGND